MFNIILFQPEIPPNTGNIIRLCACTGCDLHLIEPLGFVLDDKRLRRAGLDYHEYAHIRSHASLQDCLAALKTPRLFALTTKGEQSLYQWRYQSNDAFLFGAETRGLPQELLENLAHSQRIRLPMQAHCRSLNLSNAVAITVFEAWRQNSFA